MTESNKIKYGYARDKAGLVFHISKAHAKEDYVCLSCGRKLIPVVKVIKKSKHFRHADNNPAYACSSETYLHKLGKQVFFDTYTRCLEQGTSFDIEFATPKECRDCRFGPCSHYDKGEQVANLTKHYVKVYEPESASDAGFKPDVLLRTAKGESLWVEIAVTHKAAENKIAAGVRIVEITVSSEEDAEAISSCVLTESSRVSLYNFRRKAVVEGLGAACSRRLNVFKLYKSGFSCLMTVNAYQCATENNEKIAYIEKLSGNESNDVPTHVSKIEMAFLKGLLVKHCSLCSTSAFTGGFSAKSFFCLKRNQMLQDGLVAMHCSNFDPVDSIPEGGLLQHATARWHALRKIRDDERLQIKKVHFRGRAALCSSCGVQLFLEMSRTFESGNIELKKADGSTLIVIANPPSMPESDITEANCPRCGVRNSFVGLPNMVIRS